MHSFFTAETCAGETPEKMGETPGAEGELLCWVLKVYCFPADAPVFFIHFLYISSFMQMVVKQMFVLVLHIPESIY